MKIVCDACSAKYSIADDKVRGKSVKIKCKKCNNVIFVKGEEVAAPAGAEEAHDTRVFGYNDAPAGEEPVWHVVIDSEQVGPITASDLKQRIADGQVDADSYVWREGFDDWQPVSGVAEFAGVASAGQTMRSDLGALPAVSRAADDVASDLFGARAAAPAAQPAPAGDGRMRGERNENSVLFSLSNLASLTSDAPRSSAASASSSSAGRAQAGGSEGSGLIDIRSMASAYMGERAPARNTGRVGSMDDIPVFSGAAFAEPAVILPPTSRSSSNNKVLYGLIGAVGLLAVAAIVLVLFVFNKDKASTVAVAPPLDPSLKVPPTGAAGTIPADPADDAAAPGGTDTGAPATGTPPTPVAAATDTKPEPSTKPASDPKPSSSSRDSRKPDRSSSSSSSSSTAASSRTPEVAPTPKADAKGCSEVDCLLAEKKPACCAKYGGKPVKTESSSSGLDEDLDKAAIQSGVAKVQARAKSCSTKSSAKGKVKVRVRVGGDGSVSSTSVLESPDDALGSCVAAALQKASFKKTQNGATFTFPMTF